MLPKTLKLECRRLAEDLAVLFNEGIRALRPDLRLQTETDAFQTAFQEDREAAREALMAYEDYWKALRAREPKPKLKTKAKTKAKAKTAKGKPQLQEARRRLEAAISRLNAIPTIEGQFYLRLWFEAKGAEAHLEHTFAAEALRPTPEAVQRYGDDFTAEVMGTWLERFKRALASCGEDFPLGVCRYEKCGRFFVKKRKDEMYCTKTHAKLAWQLEKRRREKQTRQQR